MLIVLPIFFGKVKCTTVSPLISFSLNLGLTAESVELAGKGIVADGILIDVPRIRGTNWIERGEVVLPSDILKVEEKCGFMISQGDVLLERTGQLHR